MLEGVKEMTEEELNEKIIKVEGTKHQFMAAWASIKRVIIEEVPSAPAENGFLMETLTDLAKQVKDTNKNHYCRMTVRKWMGIAQCVKFILDNKMQSNEMQALCLCEILTKIMKSVEQADMMETNPLTVVG